MAYAQSHDSDAFITTWKTTEINEQVFLTVYHGDKKVNYGGDEAILSGFDPTTDKTNIIVQFKNVGINKLTISGDVTKIKFNDHEYRNSESHDKQISHKVNAEKIVSIDQWGTIKWTNMIGMFEHASNMEYKATDTPDLSLVTNMNNMFENTFSFNGDISSWDVSNVKSMSAMFKNAYKFNQPLNDWDVSSVTNMHAMFSGTASFNQPLDKWDVSSVKNMSLMFRDAVSFNQPLNDWDISSVTNMFAMFNNARTFDQNLGNWYIVTNHSGLIYVDESNTVINISTINKVLADADIEYTLSGSDAKYFIIDGSVIKFNTEYNMKSIHVVNLIVNSNSYENIGTNNHVLLMAFNYANTMYEEDKPIIEEEDKPIIEEDKVISVNTEQPKKKKSGSGNDSQWKTKPTFGDSHQTYKPLVDCGFTFDGICYDITDNWHTDFDQLVINTGETHTFALKAYSENKLKMMELQLGVPIIGESRNAEVSILAVFDYNTNIIDTSISGDVDSITNLHISNFKVKCQPSDDVEKCDMVVYTMKFLEPIQNDVLGIQAVDQKRRTQTTFLNEGFDIIGKSLNPMNNAVIAGPEKYEGSILVTQESKYSDIWVSQDGREFEKNNGGSFTQVNKVYETPEISGRSGQVFQSLLQSEHDKANESLKSMFPRLYDEPFDKIDNIFAYEFPDRVEKSEDVDLKNKMKVQEIIAQKMTTQK